MWIAGFDLGLFGFGSGDIACMQLGSVNVFNNCVLIICFLSLEFFGMKCDIVFF